MRMLFICGESIIFSEQISYISLLKVFFVFFFCFFFFKGSSGASNSAVYDCISKLLLFNARPCSNRILK